MDETLRRRATDCRLLDVDLLVPTQVRCLQLPFLRLPDASEATYRWLSPAAPIDKVQYTVCTSALWPSNSNTMWHPQMQMRANP